MKQKKLSFAFALSLLFSSSVFAEAPVIPDGPNGPLLVCQEVQDEYGCYGQLTDAFGEAIGRRPAKRSVKREIRRTKRARRQARRTGDFDLANQYSLDIDLLKSIRQAIKVCLNYDDPYCDGSGDSDIGDTPDSGGSGSGDSGTGDSGGSGNTSLSEACSVLGGNAQSNEFGMLPFEQRIVNGAQCVSAGAPTIKILNQGSQHCTGTLVNANKVVTAAHCVQTACSDLTVDDGSGNQVSLLSCTAHPSYNESTLENDLAVLTLAQNLSNNTIPVKTSGAPAVGATIALAGYGRNLSETGQSIASDALLATFAVITEVSDQGIVFDYSSSNTSYGNTCNGDSGGPHIENVNGTWMLVGVTSYGIASNCGMTEGSDTSTQANITSAWAQSFLSQQGAL